MFLFNNKRIKKQAKVEIQYQTGFNKVVRHDFQDQEHHSFCTPPSIPSYQSPPPSLPSHVKKNIRKLSM